MLAFIQERNAVYAIIRLLEIDNKYVYFFIKCTGKLISNKMFGLYSRYGLSKTCLINDNSSKHHLSTASFSLFYTLLELCK